MDKVRLERIEMLKKRAAEELNAMWDANARGDDEEIVRWHWDQFAKIMHDAMRLRKEV